MESLQDLLAVVTHLRTDLATHPERWENGRLERFLDAIAAWLTSFSQPYVNAGTDMPNPDWRFVADVLRAARTYE